jgi:hypothetical protein
MRSKSLDSDDYIARIRWWRARQTHPDADLAEEAKEVMWFYERIGILPRWSVSVDSLIRHPSSDRKTA